MSHDNSSHPVDAFDSERDDRQRVAAELAARLRSRGVQLTGGESDGELVRLLDAVERFERTVERHGGDLMVDEPADAARAREPDNQRFVLPARRTGEGVREYLDRIAEATDRAGA